MNLEIAIALFIGAAAIIAFIGTKLTRVADELADITGWGEALFGAIFLGGTTSLPGIITSVIAASNNHPELAISNAVGGIAAQTSFLAIADLAHKGVNLEHAAASFANLMQGILLIIILTVVILGMSGSEISIFHIHPFSIVIIIVYIAGSMLISKAKKKPMWKPEETKETMEDEPEEENINLSTKMVVFKFIVYALVIAAAGYTVAITGIYIADSTGLSEGFVGTVLTAVATSLPELIVSIAAVRQKALTLAVGNIIGGNTFDVLFIAFADVAYTPGSILHAISNSQLFILSLTILMTAILSLGLLHRQKQGFGKIGWESITILILYLAGNAFLFFI